MENHVKIVHKIQAQMVDIMLFVTFVNQDMELIILMRAKFVKNVKMVSYKMVLLLHANNV